MEERRSCKQCGKEYNILRRNQVFCSSTCREDYKYQQRKDDIAGIIQENNELKLRVEELIAQIEELKKQSVGKRRKQSVEA